MKVKHLSLILCSTLLFTACGSSHDDNTQTGTGTGTGTDQTSIVLIDHFSGIVLREALFGGLFDTLLEGTDELVDGASCSSGSYAKTESIISLNNCVGIFEADGKASVSGSIDITKGYSFKDLTLKFTDGTGQLVNGLLNIEENSTGANLSSTSMTVTTQEMDSAKKLRNVNYTLSDYKFSWSKQDATNVRLQVAGKIVSIGGESGDFNVAYDSYSTPFYLKIDADENIVGYPYAGSLNIYDLKTSDNTVTITTIDAQNAQYKANMNGKVLFDKTVKWSMFGD